MSTPAALDGNPEVVNTVASEESEEPGDLQLEVPQVSEEETVSSPIKKTSPSPQKAYTCTEDCSFPSGGGGKRIRCCVCARHYHVKCLNLPEDEIKGHAWPCLECRVLPHNVKYIRDSIDRLTHFMSSMMNDKITEIKDLKLKCQNFQTENETLRQRSMDLEYEMTALKSKLTDLSPTSRTPKDSLVLGSSLVRNIDPNKLANTNVCCMPGAKIADIRDKLMNLSTAGERFSHIYLVVGGNDCADSDIDMAQTVATYRDAVTTGKDIADNVTISAIPPRSSPTHALQNIVTLNTHLSSLSTEMGVSMASANDYFFLQGGDINEGYFVDHTHLTVKGSNKLAEALSLPRKDTNGLVNVCSRYPKQDKLRKPFNTNPGPRAENNADTFSHAFWQKARNKAGRGFRGRHSPHNGQQTTPSSNHGRGQQPPVRQYQQLPVRQHQQPGQQPHVRQHRQPPVRQIRPPHAQPGNRIGTIPPMSRVPGGRTHGPGKSQTPEQPKPQQTSPTITHPNCTPNFVVSSQSYASSVSNGQHDVNYCLLCGEENHRQKSCRHGIPIECFICHSMGHKSKFCSYYDKWRHGKEGSPHDIRNKCNAKSEHHDHRIFESTTNVILDINDRISVGHKYAESDKILTDAEWFHKFCQINVSPADGHCFIHSMVTSIKTQLTPFVDVDANDLIHIIFAEVSQNKELYEAFFDDNGKKLFRERLEKICYR